MASSKQSFSRLTKGILEYTKVPIHEWEANQFMSGRPIKIRRNHYDVASTVVPPSIEISVKKKIT